MKDGLGIIYAVIDKSKNKVVEYSYDAWGKLLNPSVVNTGIGKINPFIYKSYYYDKEISLYWLTTRFYDPEIGRYIQFAGSSSLKPFEINRYNPYSYASNNPIGIAYGSRLTGGSASGGSANFVVSGPTAINRGGSTIGKVTNSSIEWMKFNWPKANFVEMTHCTTQLIENEMFNFLFGNVSYVVTTQLNDSEVFYLYSDVGDDETLYGCGMNLRNWYGINAYLSSAIGFGSSLQITPWITYGAEISLRDGISFSFGIISGDTTNAVSVNVGFGVFAGEYVWCSGFVGNGVVAAITSCIMFFIDLFN